MEKVIYHTKGTCAQEIQFEKEGDVIHNIKFIGGCNGNLKAIGKLCEGMTAQQISDVLRGNICGAKSTSCADQLARAVMGE